MMPQQNAYEVRSLFFRYGSAPVGASWAVRDVNLQVKAGEILGIVGPNGSGRRRCSNFSRRS